MEAVKELRDVSSIIRKLARSKAHVTFGSTAFADIASYGLDTLHVLAILRTGRAFDNVPCDHEWRYRIAGTSEGIAITADVAIEEVSEEIKLVRVRRVWARR